ncbi:Tat pathway signal sequence domain protein [Aestuariibacter sp. GS-14]|uniref:exo-rhamnogalacturonan lyase family protein n=1 Tax=Aestuariibacter sp. GS-14 TaxID=2590670 RepID=UPI0015E84125|nr:Tat pathway signal sequence domain protein [Aestuariibacter sp. GS-14]
MDRRAFLKQSGMAASLPLALSATGCAVTSGTGKPLSPIKREPGTLSWVDGNAPDYQGGATWGHPWAQGALRKGQSLTLISEQGTPVPLQSWPTAYWPDGSIKWTAHAIPAGSQPGERFAIIAGKPVSPKAAVSITKQSGKVVVNTGVISLHIATSGQDIISEMHREGKIIGRAARLVGLVQDAPDNTPESPANVTAFTSSIDSVTVEQQGPVRSVIKIEGKHTTGAGRNWLPFALRIYAYAGAETVKISHTFIYDGDDQKDFIRGLGLRFNVVQRDELYNRHIRFVGQNDGLWGEGVKGITGLRRDPGQTVRDAQIAGVATPALSEWDERVSSRLHYIPVWNDFTLSQLSANGFAIRKRTQPGHGWIDSDQGQRANGATYVGGTSGGILFGMRDFWQLHPVQVDVRNAGSDLAEATLWFWSPEAPAMDVRFYHDGMGQDTYDKQLDALNIIYEDYEPGFGSAYGVARTTDFTLGIMNTTPSREQTVAMAHYISQAPQVVAAPQDYLAAGVFGGLWTLPDRSSPAKSAIEDRLDFQVKYYCSQVDQRHWYGFWNFGDVMHTYDTDRHVWRYDIGGYAWDNSELSPDLWLWYSFLRTGDPTTFHLAENMTRHNRDVDIYHAGKFKGLGTRHNVQHWGCSAKQMRISTAAYRRFHYYITGDDRTGDVLNEVINADQALGVLNPTRKVARENPLPGMAKIGVGTDWGSTAANWLTAWERTGDKQYRDRLVNAMTVIGEHPLGFFAGAFGYDTATQTLLPYELDEPSISHLSSVFGLVEMNAELNQLIDIPAYKQAWMEYGRLYNADEETQKAALGIAKRPNLKAAHSRLTAYTAYHNGDVQLAKRAWKEFDAKQEFAGLNGLSSQLQTTHVEGPNVLNPIDEAPWISTNDASQWGLAAIQNLALVGNALE